MSRFHVLRGQKSEAAAARGPINYCCLSNNTRNVKKFLPGNRRVAKYECGDLAEKMKLVIKIISNPLKKCCFCGHFVLQSH